MSDSDEFEHEQGYHSLSSESASLSVGTETNHAGGLSDDSSLTIARAETEAVNQRESAVKQRLHLRWSSSSRVIVDRPPSRPLTRQLSGGPSNGGSVKESRKDPGVGDAHRRGNASKRVHQNHSRWASGSGVINDRPPFQSPGCRGSAVDRLHQTDSRWSSGCRGATFDATLSEALARLIQKNHESIDLGEEAMAQLRSYVSIIATTMHRDNPPHNFEHASHATSYVARTA
jgi:hypothetical protein